MVKAKAERLNPRRSSACCRIGRAQVEQLYPCLRGDDRCDRPSVLAAGADPEAIKAQPQGSAGARPVPTIAQPQAGVAALGVGAMVKLSVQPPEAGVEQHGEADPGQVGQQQPERRARVRPKAQDGNQDRHP